MAEIEYILVPALLMLLMIPIGAADAHEGRRFWVNASFYNDSDAEIHNIEIRNSTATSNFYRADEDFRIELVDERGETIFSRSVPIGFITYLGGSGGVLTLEKRSINKGLWLPYSEYDGATHVVVRYEGDVIEEESISDSVCEGEDPDTAYCTEPAEESEEGDKVEADGDRGVWYYLLTGAAVLVLLGGLIWLSWVDE